MEIVVAGGTVNDWHFKIKEQSSLNLQGHE